MLYVDGDEERLGQVHDPVTLKKKEAAVQVNLHKMGQRWTLKSLGKGKSQDICYSSHDSFHDDTESRSYNATCLNSFDSPNFESQFSYHISFSCLNMNYSRIKIIVSNQFNLN